MEAQQRALLRGQRREPAAGLAQRIAGTDGDVEVELDDVEPADADAAARDGGELGIAFEHTAHERLDRSAHRQVDGRVVADQQGRQRHLALRLAEQVGDLQQVAQHAGAHGVHQHRGAERTVVLAQAGDDGTGQRAPVRAAVARAAEHHGRGAQRAGVDTQAVALAEVAAEQVAVDQHLRAGDRVLLVLADHDRLLHRAQVHGLDGHLEAELRRLGHAVVHRAAEQAQLDRARVVGRRRAGVVAHRLVVLGGTQHRRLREQAGGGTGLQQLDDRAEVGLGGRQVAVHRRHVVEAADAADAAGLPGHGAVAARGAHHLQAAALLAHAAGRVARHAEHVDALLLVVGRQRGPLAAVLRPQPGGRVEHRLRRRARLAVAEPQVAHLALHGLPGRRLLVVVEGAAVALALEDVDEARLGQQLQRAAEAGDDVEHLLHVVRHVQPHQRAQGVALAEQVLDHRMRALVRRAEHHQPRARALHHRVHHRPALVDAGAHHQAAHAVREQADRPVGLLQQAVEEFAQSVGQHVQRLPPVVGKAFDAVGARELLAQLAVEHAEQLVGLDAGLIEGDLGQAAGGDVQRVEPDAVAAVGAQVRAHHAGQHHHHRPIGRLDVAAGARGLGQRGGVLARRRQGAEHVQRARLGLDQPVAQRGARVAVGEVAEVRDIGAAVEQHARGRLRRDAGEHRGGVHYEVVVVVVEEQEVGEQHAQALEQVAALDVAGDHRHRHAVAHRRVAQQPRHR